MGLFRSKSTVLSEGVSARESLDIQKIPDIFYGGNNPVIYETLPTSKSTGIVSDRTVTPAATTSPRPSQFTEPVTPVPVSKLIWIVVIVGIIVVGGASAYFVIQYLSARENVITSTSTSTIVTSAPTTTLSTTTSIIMVSSTVSSASSTTSTSGGVTSTSSLTTNFLEFPPVNLGTTADIDLDRVTDIEEVLYGTDSGGWDTDEDGYYDGLEVTNLYNPRGFAPVRIIDSGLVREYINQFSGYRIYYPMQWQQGAVDPEARQVLFSAITGEYVEVRVFPKAANSTFADWFQLNASGEQFGSLSPFTNRFGTQGFRRSDNLVAYFSTDLYVFTLLYHQSDSRAPVPFRTTFEMMYQSFRPSQTSAQLPEQQQIETLPITTTSSDDEIVSSSTTST